MSYSFLKKAIKSQKGSAILMLTILILASILTVSLVSADIVINGLKSGRIQNFSTIAFFAAEAGAERVLYDIRKLQTLNTISCTNPGTFCFDAASNGNIDECTDTGCTNFDNQVLTNNAEYWVEYEESGQWTTITSTGSYNDTNRVIEISFCAPLCAGVNCGADDGCGDPCPPTCESNYGCQLAQPANTVEVDPGSCCTGACYECDTASGFGWDGDSCENNTYCGDGIQQDPNGLGESELCDGTSPLGGNQECSLDCQAIGYGFYMENNTTINMDNDYFTATNNDERYVDVTCKDGRTIDVYGLCETGMITCVSGAEGTANCEIGCTGYNIPGNQSYYQFVCE